MNNKFKDVDFDALAISFIDTYESDRNESGRKELVSGLEYMAKKIETERDFEIFNNTLISICGHSFDTLARQAKDIDVNDYF